MCPSLAVLPTLGTKTILILGASYGGARVARVISEFLGKEGGFRNWRVVVVDRNSHANHVYVFPRFTLLPQHGIKSFIPYKNLLHQPTINGESVSTNLFIRGHILSLSNKSAKIQTISTDEPDGFIDLPYEYLVYALGSTLPEPVDPWHAHTQFLKTEPRSISPTSSTSGEVSVARDIDVSSLLVDLPSIEPRSPSPPLPPTPVSSTSSLPYLKPQPSLQGSIDVSPWLPPTPPCSTPELRAHSLGQKVVSSSRHEHVKGAGTLEYGLKWMKERGAMVQKAKRVIVLGGGALGIQFATDIKDLFPEKEVTLLHSRERLLPIYPIEMHEAIAERCEELGINLILGERAQSIETKLILEDGVERPEVVVTTSIGRAVEADMVLPCTGQRPNTAIISSFLPHAIVPTTQRLSVRRTMQLSPSPAKNPSEDPIEDHIFAIGDCADAFGAIQSGNAAWYQANVTSENLIRLIKKQEGLQDEKLEEYSPNGPMIKVTLGLKRYVKCIEDKVTEGDDGIEDLQAKVMWPLFGAEDLMKQLVD